MALFITSLNSGSNGNCYYIGNETEAILVDAGLSCRETEKRMRSVGLSMNLVKAILVSHEHGDHIKGVPVIAAKYDLPVYISGNTWLQGGTGIPRKFVQNLSAYEPVQIGGLTILAFPKHHDACDPHSFIVSCNGITVGVFTDIGEACEHVTRHFASCHAAFLETNYDEALLDKGSYPIYLKNRIRGGKGHLSNTQALEIFTRHRPPFMSHLLLSHLSRDNNDPGLVKELFTNHAGNTQIVVASRYEPTAVFTIQNAAVQTPEAHTVKLSLRPKQMSLFG